MAKVAIITGGVSGMGLAVAEGLLQRGEWNLHLFDINENAGAEVVARLGKQTTFHQTNVTNYSSISKAFDDVFKTEKRLDFVFANAGVVERYNFYEKHENSPPPEPDQLTIDINLKAVISTTYLAQHYFRLSPADEGATRSLVMTASTGSLYPAPFCSIYTASKHGVLGFMRSIADNFYNDKIRVNAICPSTVKTNLLDEGAWNEFPLEYFTPLSKIVDTVLMFIDGGDLVDTKGVKYEKGKDYGLAAEVSQTNHYFREVVPFGDEIIAITMGSTKVGDASTDRRFK